MWSNRFVNLSRSGAACFRVAPADDGRLRGPKVSTTFLPWDDSENDVSLKCVGRNRCCPAEEGRCFREGSGLNEWAIFKRSSKTMRKPIQFIKSIHIYAYIQLLCH